MKTQTQPNTPILYSTSQAAKAWGISRWRIYDLVKQCQLRPIIGMGKGWKFMADDYKAIELVRL